MLTVYHCTLNYCIYLLYTTLYLNCILNYVLIVYWTICWLYTELYVECILNYMLTVYHCTLNYCVYLLYTTLSVNYVYWTHSSVYSVNCILNYVLIVYWTIFVYCTPLYTEQYIYCLLNCMFTLYCLLNCMWTVYRTVAAWCLCTELYDYGVLNCINIADRTVCRILIVYWFVCWLFTKRIVDCTLNTVCRLYTELNKP